MVLVLTATTSQAGLVQTFGIGANATAQAEAVVAHANDPFAVYYNPAGLTLIQKPVITSGIMVYDATVKISDFKVTSSSTPGVDYTPGPADFQTVCPEIYNPTMGFAMPLNDQWSFGVAAYAPYGLHLRWDTDHSQNPGALYAWESKFVRKVLTPAFGYKVSNRLSLGAGISLGTGTSDAGKTYPANPATGADPTLMKLESDDEFNWSFNVGLMYMPMENLSLGLTYRSRTNADFQGDVLINGIKTSTVTMDYDLPECVQAGARYGFTDTLSMEVDMIWTRWDIHAEQVEKSPLAPGGSFHHDRDWRNRIQCKIGLEWKPVDAVALRAGYAYDPTPVPDHTFDLGWPDTDRNIYSLGMGLAIQEHWQLDLVLQYVRSTSVRQVNGNSTELNQNYGQIVQAATGGAVSADTVAVSLGDEGILWGLGLTLSYHF